MESVSIGGTSAVFPTSVVVKDYRITDKYAEKEGYDINGQAEYLVTIGGYNGIGFVSEYYTLRSQIKLVDLYSNSAYLYQGRSVSY
ncbi:hypothetical protein RZN25_18405 [Bacillaceae bacterium S4-13-56]